MGNVKEDSVFYNNSLKASKSLDELKAKIHTSRVFVSTVSSFYSNLRILNRDDPNGGKLTFDCVIKLGESGSIRFFENFSIKEIKKGRKNV